MSDLDQDRPSSPEHLPATSDTKSNSGVTAADDDRFECRACGYTYDPNQGDPKNKIIAGTPFSALPATWKCPVCGAKHGAFSNIGTTSTASGFKENLRYGIGVNNMSPEQKNLLIFGGLGIGFILFLSLYTLN
jgi:rubredoxin